MSELLVPPPATTPATPLLPPLLLAAALTCCAGAAALAYCALLAALLRRSNNGLFTILIQLTASDVILLGTIAPELWSYNSRTWSFGLAACVAYKGIDVFASTASVYLIATLALHSLATLNLEERDTLRRIKRNHDVEDEEMRSSRHSLMANSDSSTPPRTMNIDYRMADTRIPVATPVIFVWVLALSLSVPEFALATLSTKDGATTCSVADSNHRVYIHTMLAVFNLILPMFMFCVIIALAVAKLKAIRRMVEIVGGETVCAVKLAISLILVYILLCVPRSVLSVYRVYFTSDGYSESSSLVQPNVLISVLCLAFSCASLIAHLTSPILCIVLLPHLRRVFTMGAKNASEDNV